MVNKRALSIYQYNVLITIWRKVGRSPFTWDYIKPDLPAGVHSRMLSSFRYRGIMKISPVQRHAFGECWIWQIIEDAAVMLEQRIGIVYRDTEDAARNHITDRRTAFLEFHRKHSAMQREKVRTETPPSPGRVELLKCIWETYGTREFCSRDLPERLFVLGRGFVRINVYIAGLSYMKFLDKVRIGENKKNKFYKISEKGVDLLLTMGVCEDSSSQDHIAALVDETFQDTHPAKSCHSCSTESEE